MTARRPYALCRGGMVTEVIFARDLNDAWQVLTGGRVAYFQSTGWTVTPCEIVLPATAEVQG